MPTIQGVSVRVFTDTDSFDELTALLHRAYAPLSARGLQYVACDQSVEVTKSRARAGECYVAIHEGKVVGTVTLVPPSAAPEVPYYQQPGVSYFQQYAVEPELQGNGIGRQLMEHIERRARELGATELALDTAQHATELISTYLRNGYEIVSAYDWPMTNYESLVLSRRL